MKGGQALSVSDAQQRLIDETPSDSRSLSASAQNIVSGGDDKTVRLWDVERKSCSAAAVGLQRSMDVFKLRSVALWWDGTLN